MCSDESDVELVRRFQGGDYAAFDAIVLRFQDRIFRLAVVSLYDGQNAADATQEVFLRAFRGFRRFAFRSEPFTWLYRMTKNVCQEFNRRRPTSPLLEEPSDPSGNTEQELGREVAARKVRELVSGLPERQREVVVLRIFEELSVRDTATAMGCKEGTVKALLHKATAQLKKKMTLSRKEL